jgi:hypothetical protein
MLKMQRVTENPSEFSPGNHLCKVKRELVVYFLMEHRTMRRMGD